VRRNAGLRCFKITGEIIEGTARRADPKSTGDRQGAFWPFFTVRARAKHPPRAGLDWPANKDLTGSLACSRPITSETEHVTER
jgi:hypothetical protein